MSFIDLTGKRFGRLVVVRRGEDYVRKSGSASVRWECKCDCGNTVLVRGYPLKNAETRSCGCYRAEKMSVPHDYTVDGKTAYLNVDGSRVLIDADDIPKIRGDWWYIGKNGYAYSNHKKKLMHRMIAGAKKDRSWIT